MDSISNPSENHDKPPAGDLLAMVYEELRGLAARQMSRFGDGVQTLQPTALVHEAWLRLTSKNPGSWNSSHHFFCTAAIAMRRILVDRVRHKCSHKRTAVPLDLNPAPDTHDSESRILAVDDCLRHLETVDPDCAKVVQLKFFGGLTNQETAELLGTSLRNVERRWAFARAKLYQMIRDRDPADST
jgi:RNA polymerase sigma factor (TIGR02999 family)